MTAWVIKEPRTPEDAFAPIDIIRNLGQLDIPVVLLSIGLTVTGIGVGGFPVGQAAAMGLLLVAALRRTRNQLGPAGWLLGLALVVALYLTLVSAMSPVAADGQWPRRLFRLAINCALMFSIVSARLPLRSVVVGIVAGMAANVPLFFAGLVPHNYGSYLSGIFGDKNQAGLWYAVMGLLIAGFVQRSFTRVLSLACIGGALFLTGSRTSLAAFAAGLLWIALSAKLPFIARWMVAFVLAWGVDFIEQNYARVGIYADRLGSDLLRDRIDAASQIKVNASPFFGDGLGQATVNIQNNDWFFHNSYWSLRVEGGVPLLLIVVAITVWFGIRPFRNHAVDWSGRCIEAASLAMMVCAFRLGEVFLTTVWFVVMAAALSKIRDETEARQSGTDHAAARTAVPDQVSGSV